MSGTSPDLFGLAMPAGAPDKAPVQAKAWYLATNQQNLNFMLAAGLATGPAGFGRKYYADPLGACPGWLPLFAGSPPQAAWDLALSEGEYLRPVAVALDLGRLRGEVHALGRDAVPRPLRFPEGLTGDETALLVPAPLPATWIAAIHFASKADRSAVEAQAADYANVPLGDFKRQVGAALFSGKSACPWPPVAHALPARDLPLHDCYGVGGAMALAHALAERGRGLAETARCLFDPPSPSSDREPAADAVLSALERWACLAAPDGAQDLQGRLLLAVLDAIVQAKARADREPAGPAPDLHRVVLDCLAAEARALPPDRDKWKRALEEDLPRDLLGLLGLGDQTVSQALERHRGAFSRGLALFFLRDRPQGLLGLESPLLNPLDLAVAAALFGARSGWMGLPAEVRERPGLREAAVHRMAALAHRLAGSGLDLGPAPQRPVSLRECLGEAGGDWSRAEREAALALARGMGWDRVLRTRISLGKGDYRLQIDGRGVHLLLDGEPKAASVEVDRAALLALLAASAVPPKLEAQVHAILARGRKG